MKTITLPQADRGDRRGPGSSTAIQESPAQRRAPMHKHAAREPRATSIRPIGAHGLIASLQELRSRKLATPDYHHKSRLKIWDVAQEVLAWLREETILQTADSAIRRHQTLQP